MPGLTAQQPLGYVPSIPARARAWRPFPREVLDVVCTDHGGAGLPPQIHARATLVVIPASAVVRIESGRSLAVEHGWVVLVPAWSMYAVRPHPVTQAWSRQAAALRLSVPEVARLTLGARAGVISDAAAGAQADALIAQLRRPVRSLERADALRAMLQRLAASSRPLPVPRASATDDPLTAVREHLRGRLDEQVPTSDLVRLSGLSECHLIRAFHRTFGLPPHAYHVRLRLAAASELLADGVSVSAAAYECGFADQSHLSRQFKQVYGLTPAAWARAVTDPSRCEMAS